MDWQEIYESRKRTAADVAQMVSSGDAIVVAHAAAEPSALVNALVDNKEAYEGVEITHMVCMGRGEYCLPENSRYFRHNALFVGGNTRKAVAEGRGDFTPCYLSQVPGFLRDGTVPVDIFFGQVSPPDKNGYCSFGVSVDYERAALDGAKKFSAVVVNPNMPRTLGDSFIHVSEIDYFVEDDTPLVELGRPVLTDVEKEIGRYCASLIQDGDCLQLGIGSLPDAVLLFLKEKKDLGIHSEMISDGVMELMKSGVVNNRKKTLHRGKAVMTFAMGSRAFYDFMDDNPVFQLMPADYTNDPYVIAQNDHMISINSCVEVDFYGQLASESIGKTQISGTGGQVDFIRGATMSKGGKSIIVVPSTAQKGAKSKIVPFLSEGTPVTCGRCEVDYIVTEYGIAHLRGKRLRERAAALIRIAHPKFRGELLQAYEELFHQKLTPESVGL